MATHSSLAGESSLDDLRTFGVTIPVEVGATAGIPPLGPLSGVALVDFGASRTCVRTSTAYGLGLPLAGTEQFLTGSGIAALRTFYVKLRFPTLEWEVDPLVVAGINTLRSVGTNPALPIMALIGRDLLSYCRFEWDGPKGSWSLHYS